MAQNITIWGASYSNVPAVTLPKTGGGTARFDDTSDANATASDILSGKTAYVNGVKLTGTATGGGSGGITQDQDGYLVLDPTGGGGGGSGLTTIASGTFTGNGNYDIAVSVGKKMPQTDFWVKFNAQDDTEFTYDTNYKPATATAVVFSEYGHFDLSTVADGKQVIANSSYDVNNEGTITSVAVGKEVSQLFSVRNTSASYSTPNNFRVNRKSDHFEVRLYQSNPSYVYPNGIIYDWEIVYFGSNPSTDIVEIA